MRLSTGTRCVWCNGSDGELRTIWEVTPNRFGLNPRKREYTVHPRHEDETRAYLRDLRENASLFVKFAVGWVVVGFVLFLVALSMSGGEGAEEAWATMVYGPYTVALGLFVVRYPYSTPETVRWLGLRAARKLARLMGWVTVGLGIWILTVTAW